MPDIEPKVALLAGASGFAGSAVLEALLNAPDIARVFAITRRPLAREHQRLANRIVQFGDRNAALEAQLKGLKCHVAFCCLGSSLSRAGSEDGLRSVEIDHVLSFARAAKAAQAQRFVVLSAVGADPRAKSMRLRVKAAMEEAVATVGFSSLDIMQPGTLIGWRSQMGPRDVFLTAVLPALNPLLRGVREPYRAMPVQTLAAAMVGVARSGRRGVQRYTYSSIQALSRLKPVRTLAANDSKAPAGAK